MIRIELFKKSGHLVKSIDFGGNRFQIGRSLESDLIIPDFDLKECEAKIIFDKDGYTLIHDETSCTIVDKQTIFLGNYKLVLTNLIHYAGTIPDKKKHALSPWKKSLMLASSLIILLIAFTIILSVKSLVFRSDFQYLLSVFGAYLIFGSLFSMISKVLNHEYHFWKIFNLVTVLICVVLLTVFNSLGIRWLPGRIFELNLIWSTFSFALYAVIYFKLIEIVFESLGKAAKFFIFLSPILLIFIYVVAMTFPFQDKYEYLSRTPKPPVFEIFESKIITEEDFLKKIDSID